MITGKKFSLIVFVILVFGCDEKAFNPATSKGPDFSLTPMENEEAELAALHLSGEIMAPIGLYQRIRSDLAIIRENWSDHNEHVNIKFDPFWEVSVIGVDLTSTTYYEIESGNYHNWDSISVHTALDSIHYFGCANFCIAKLVFKGRLNPILLVDEYSGLPGFNIISTYSKPMDRSNLYLQKNGNVIKYFFRYAYGECPAGCLNSEIYYFTVESGEPVYRGSLYLPVLPDSTIPVWADTYTFAYRDYIAHNCWPCQ